MQVHIDVKNNTIILEPISLVEVEILEQYLENQSVLISALREESGELKFLGIEFGEASKNINLSESEKLVANPMSEEEIESLYDQHLDEMEIECEVEI